MNKISHVKALKSRIFCNQSGATAIEYSVIAGGIALMILAGVAIIGPQLSEGFNSIGTALKTFK